MPLIQTDRLAPGDLEAWQVFEAQVRRYALKERRRLARLTLRAADAVRAFVDAGPAWCGVSWGKDSVVVADIVQQVAPEVPLCWMRTLTLDAPECRAVRDAFLQRFPSSRYGEYDDDGVVEQSADGLVFDDAKEWPPAADHGPRYIYGLRADESRARRLRFWFHGENSKNTCAPISLWSHMDVFAHLLLRELPIHPAYAMSRGGALSPEWLRVAPIGGHRGTGMGRRQWEAFYYQDVLDRIPELFPPDEVH